MDPKKEIEKLKNLIEQYNYSYYVLNDPKVTDQEFDDLLNKLKNLEKNHPQHITADSPTQRVGGTTASQFNSHPHSQPMISLDNVYSFQGFEAWWKRVQKNLENPSELEVIVEPKMDGVSLALIYENGILAKAATRGDGTVGEDVTLNARSIRSIPLKLHALKTIPKMFECRGEVYFLKKDFERLNHSLLKNQEKAFVNPRNAASGSLRQKNPQITQTRPLRFVVHSIGEISKELALQTHLEYLHLCEEFYLPVHSQKIQICKNPKEVKKLYEEWNKNRVDLPYEIDGLVIKVNSLRQQKILGTTAKSPRWAIAFKFKAHQAETQILQVEYSIGRTGVITPVAKVRPVTCGGVTISSISLHNFDEIKRLEVKEGDTVLIERAGDVIPKVVRTLQSNPHGKEILPPKKCPSCKSEIFHDDQEVAYRCVNLSCPAQLERALFHFASRDGMNIEGLGESIIRELIQKNLVKDFSDLYSLKKEDLLQCELFADKKAENLLKQIEGSKKRSLSSLLIGLGIPHVGEKVALTLAEHFTTLEKIVEAKIDELMRIEELGPIISESIENFFKQKNTRDLLRHFKKAGVNFAQPKNNFPTTFFTGKNILFTGELQTLSRSQVQERIREMGGTPIKGISKKTDFLVCGANPGSKLEKAKKLKIPILTEEEFLKLAKKS